MMHIVRVMLSIIGLVAFIKALWYLADHNVSWQTIAAFLVVYSIFNWLVQPKGKR